MPYRVSAKLAEEQLNFQNRDYSSQALESLYRFFLGSIAGGTLRNYLNFIKLQNK
jgi:hypothetical protein